jgi:hypothetical protein
MWRESLVFFALCIAPAAHAGVAVTTEQAALFKGCWMGEGKFVSSGRPIQARVQVSAANVPDAIVYVHDDTPPGRYHSTALWSSRNGTTLMSETNSSGGYRIFEATEATKNRIVFTSRGQLDDLLAPSDTPTHPERFTYALTSPESYRMQYEAMRDGAWRLVDFIDFKRCGRQGDTERASNDFQ